MLLRRPRSDVDLKRDKLEDDIAAGFDPREIEDPRLHATNCVRRNILYVAMIRSLKDSIRDLNDKSDRNYMMIFILLVISMLRAFVSPDKFAELMGAIIKAF